MPSTLSHILSELHPDRSCAHTGAALSKDSLRSQSVIQAFPSGEGVSRVSRKRKTDEGKNATVFRGTSQERVGCDALIGS